MKICVLISTYNGEKYLEEQLQSIIDQKGLSADILVRDDGSTDRTCEILDAWQNDGKLKWYAGQNLGFALSFLDLMSHAGDYEYYAFCDQDDIWLPDKLLRAVTALEGIDDKVKLYCSNVYYYKDGQTYGGIHNQAPKFDKYTCLLRNIAPGCSMVFDKGLNNLVISSSPEKLIAHDFWVFQTAVLLGTVHYDFQSGMLYRQHENNQIGQKKSFVAKIKRRLKNVFSVNKNEREAQAKELIRCYDNIMSRDTKSIVSLIAGYRGSFSNKMNLLLNRNFQMQDKKSTFYLKLRILFNAL